MTAGRPHPTLDELLDAFVTAWHAGEAPNVDAFAARAGADDRDELVQLIGAFLQLAPTVEPTPARSGELAADPLVERIAAIEGEAWAGGRYGVEAAAASGAAAAAGSADASFAAAGEPGAETADAGSTADAAPVAPWGQRLRSLREAAGLSVGDLAGRFADRFGLRPDDAEAAPQALTALEAGKLPSEGVAARAARALEELLAAPKGALAAGAAPAFGGPILRGSMPEDPDERSKFADLLREVDEALAIESAAADEDEPETLSELLGS